MTRLSVHILFHVIPLLLALFPSDSLETIYTVESVVNQSRPKLSEERDVFYLDLFVNKLWKTCYFGVS